MLHSRLETFTFHSLYWVFIKKYAEQYSSHSWSHITPEFFNHELSQFLHSPSGANYRNQFKFAGELKCGEPVPPILVSIINYQHVILESASQWVPAMDWYVLDIA